MSGGSQHPNTKKLLKRNIAKYLYHERYMMVEWKVDFHEKFRSEIADLPSNVRIELAAHFILLREKGLRLGRPEVDTLEGSKHANMKELRIKVLKVQWRFAFAPSIRKEKQWFYVVARRAE